MLAVGPVAILPSPVFAALPTYVAGTNSGSFTVTNGSVSSTTGTGIIQASDRSVLVWSSGAFNIASGEAYNFQVPGGSVLNKVGFASGADTATINGTLLSSGRVFVLANGNISVSGTAQINTQGGLVLSTLAETNDFAYTTGGNLAFTGNSTGNITLGTGGSQLLVSNGGLSAWAGTISTNNVSVTGDLVLNSRNSTLSLTGSGGNTVVNGGLSASSNGQNISQASGNLIVSGVTTLNTNGNATVTLTNGANDFASLAINSGTSAVSINDTNSVILNTSSVGGALTVNANGDISTAGAVTAAGAVNLNSLVLGNVTFANGSSAGSFASNVKSGTVTANTVGNLTTGAIVTGGVAIDTFTVSGAGSGYTTAPTVTVAGGGGSGLAVTAVVTNNVVTGFTITNPGSGYTSSPTITLSGGGSNPTSNATITIPISSSLAAAQNSVVTVNSTIGGAGYDMNNLPTVSISGNGTVVPVWQNGVLTGLTVTGQGAGYSAAPTVTITGGTTPVVGANTTAISALLTLAPVSLPGTGTVVSGGSGYTTSPTITISGNGAATAGISGNAVANVTVGTVGSNYTSSPTVTLSGGGSNPTSAASGTAVTYSNGGNISVSSTGIVTVGNNISGGNVSIVAPSIVATNGTVGSNGTVTYNATGGNLTVGNTNARAMTLTSTGGNIAQLSGTALTHIVGGNVAVSPTTVINAGSTGNITLTNNNTLKGVVQLTGKDVSLTNTGAITIGSTVTTGNLAISTAVGNNTASVTLGTGLGTAAQDLNVGANLTINTNGAIITDDLGYSNQYVFGTTTINTANGTAAGANVSLNSAALSPNGKTGRFGQFNANTGTNGTLTVSENTSMNLGNITANGGTIRSVNSDIVINGNVSMTGAVTFNASSGAIVEGAAGTLVTGNTASFNTSNSFGTNLSNTSNSFGGNITIINGGNNIIVANSSVNFTPGNVTGGTVSVTTVGAGQNITLVAGNATAVTMNSAGRSIIAGGLFRNVTITAGSNASNSIESTGNFTLNGTLSLTSLGNVSIVGNSTASANITGSVVLANVVGDAAINSGRDITISGTAGNLTVGAGIGGLSSGVVASSYANPWNVTLGNLNVKSLSARASNGGTVNSGTDSAVNGTSGIVRQAAGSNVHVENDATFITYQNDIVVANNGNSAGRVSLSTGGAAGTAGAGNVTYTEDATAKIGNVATNGTATLTSRFGSIIEDSANNVNVSAKGLLTLNAAAGSVQLGNQTHTAGVTTGDIVAVNITASGAAQVISTNNVVLGSTAANSLVVTGNVISQSAPLNIYGLSTFNSANGIALTDAGNNFGPIVANVSTGGRNIAITEANTLNLRTVSMPNGGNGTFTATSVNGDIIDTGLGGAKMGGNVTGTGSGLVTLSAVNGNITIDDPTSDFLTTSGVVFNGKNVTLSVLGNNSTSLVLGASGVASSASGNLVASSALGSIANAGALTVGGNAFFQATNGSIVINQPNVGFGTLKFIGQQVSIAESGNMDVQTGSASFGVASLSSNGGNISIVDVGGVVSFGSTASLVAAGNITLSKVQAVNTVTVNAAGTKDLSALSLSADLNSKTPVDLGAGAGPSTNTALAPKP